jgi:hypothetical protein
MVPPTTQLTPLFFAGQDAGNPHTFDSGFSINDLKWFLGGQLAVHHTNIAVFKRTLEPIDRRPGGYQT